MGVVVLVLTVALPLIAMLSPARARPGVLTVVLFGLAVCTGLSAVTPGFGPGLAFHGLAFHPTLLHPVLLAAAVSSTTSCDTPRTSLWKSAFAARTAAFGLVLGLPMATWLSTIFSRPATFALMACTTALVGALTFVRCKSRRISRHTQAKDSMPAICKIWIPFATISLQYAAMFAVFSNALGVLKGPPAFSDGCATMLMVVFGVGGVLGASIAGHLMRQFANLVALSQPILLAASYLSLFAFGHTANLAAVLAVLVWGAAHATGMLVTRTMLAAHGPRPHDATTAIHACAASVGVLLGVSLAAVFNSAFGSVGIVLCGFVLAIVSLVAVAAQLSRMEAAAIVAS